MNGIVHEVICALHGLGVKRFAFGGGLAIKLWCNSYLELFQMDQLEISPEQDVDVVVPAGTITRLLPHKIFYSQSVLGDTTMRINGSPRIELFEAEDYYRTCIFAESPGGRFVHLMSPDALLDMYSRLASHEVAYVNPNLAAKADRRLPIIREICGSF